MPPADLLQRAAGNPGSLAPGDVLALQRIGGNRAVGRLMVPTPSKRRRRPAVQLKLAVGPAGDRYEQEADRVAGAVMRAPEPTPLSVRQPDEPIQRLPGAAPQIGLEGGEAGSEIESKLAANQGAGVPLPPKTRSEMENRIGADFGGVVVHADSEADDLNRQLGAQAFTHGQHIYMGEGKYNPGTTSGKLLLAHELTHVVQQTGQAAPVQRALPPRIQRHGSAEHMLLGQTDPQQLADVARTNVSTENRVHVLGQELQRLKAWHDKGSAAVTEADGATFGVQMVEIGGNNKFWLTNGELNAMPDYVANPGELQTDNNPLGPIIEHIRVDSIGWIRKQAVRIINEERDTLKPKAGPDGGEPEYDEDTQRRRNELEALENQLPELGLTEKKASETAINVARPLDAIGVSVSGAVETKALDAVTAQSGVNKYSNLLGRNACHFVPFSWDRWHEFHTQARQTAQAARTADLEAEAAGRDGDDALRQTKLDDKRKKLNEARIQNGYADHFLQDSFASGHLINKTLVMQWYVEWMKATKTTQQAVAANLLGASKSLEEGAEESSRAGKEAQASWSGWGFGLGTAIGGLRRAGGEVASLAKRGVAAVASTASTVNALPKDWEKIKDMDPTNQPGLAGRHMYQGPERQRGPNESADPQTAEEQPTQQARIAKSGVDVSRDPDAYKKYLSFLSRGPIQLVTNKLHNVFCETGLTVRNGANETFKVHGDYALLTSGPEVAKGVAIAAGAAQLSQQAIQRLSEGGQPPSIGEIFRHFPQEAALPKTNELVPLEALHYGANGLPAKLKEYTVKEIFEPMYQTVWNNVSAAMDIDRISTDEPF